MADFRLAAGVLRASGGYLVAVPNGAFKGYVQDEPQG